MNPRLRVRGPGPGVWTFSPHLAERDNDGSRGLEPTDRGEHTIRRRGTTAERSNRTVIFNRRSATPEQDTPCVRGLKSTATIMPSLREARRVRGPGLQEVVGRARSRSGAFGVTYGLIAFLFCLSIGTNFCAP